MSGTILTDKTIKSESQKDNILMSSKDENVNENDKTLTSLKDKNEKQNNYKNASKKKRWKYKHFLEHMGNVDDKIFKKSVTVKILTVL